MWHVSHIVLGYIFKQTSYWKKAQAWNSKGICFHISVYVGLLGQISRWEGERQKSVWLLKMPFWRWPTSCVGLAGGVITGGLKYLRISACACAGWIWDFCIKGWSGELWEGGFPSSCGQFSRNTEHHSIDPRTGCPKTRPSPSKHGVL